jgi:hypothetical protein
MFAKTTVFVTFTLVLSTGACAAPEGTTRSASSLDTCERYPLCRRPLVVRRLADTENAAVPHAIARVAAPREPGRLASVRVASK